MQVSTNNIIKAAVQPELNNQKEVSINIKDRESFEDKYTELYYDIVKNDLNGTSEKNIDGAYTKQNAVSSNIQEFTLKFLKNNPDIKTLKEENNQKIHDFSTDVINKQAIKDKTLNSFFLSMTVTDFEKELFDNFTFVNFDFDEPSLIQKKLENSILYFKTDENFTPDKVGQKKFEFMTFLSIAKKMNVDKETMASSEFQIEAQKMIAGGMHSDESMLLFERTIPKNENHYEVNYTNNSNPKYDYAVKDENIRIKLKEETSEKYNSRFLDLAEKKQDIFKAEEGVTHLMKVLFSDKIASTVSNDQELLIFLQKLQDNSKDDIFTDLLKALKKELHNSSFFLDNVDVNLQGKIEENKIIGKIYA